MSFRNLSIDELVTRIQALMEQHSGPVLVAFDGGSGAGKSTLAHAVAAQIPAVIVESDDFFANEIEDGEWDRLTPAQRADAAIDWKRLRAEALEPLLESRPACWRRPDFAHPGRGLSELSITATPERLILLDGIYSGRRELGDLVDLPVLIEAPSATRSLRHDQREDRDENVWHKRWDAAEDHYFTHVRPRSSFGAVVNTQTSVVYFLGYPGVGKYTISCALAALNDACVIDNMLINHPIYSILKWDGRSRMPPGVEEKTAVVRNAVLGAIEEFGPPPLNYIFTNNIDDTPQDIAVFQQIERVAESRGALFVPVLLKCSRDEQLRRVVTEDRAKRLKMNRADQAIEYMRRNPQYQPTHPSTLHLDTTDLRPEEAAAIISKHIESLKRISSLGSRQPSIECRAVHLPAALHGKEFGA